MNTYKYHKDILNRNGRVIGRRVDTIPDNIVKQIRADAIDEFVHKVKEHHYVLSDYINSTDYGMFTVGIEQIAEELKAGEHNAKTKSES